MGPVLGALLGASAKSPTAVVRAMEVSARCQGAPWLKLFRMLQDCGLWRQLVEAERGLWQGQVQEPARQIPRFCQRVLVSP